MSTFVSLIIAVFVFCLLFGVLASLVRVLIFPIFGGIFSYFIGWGFWPGCLIGLVIGVVKLFREPGKYISNVNFTTRRGGGSSSSDGETDSCHSDGGRCRFYEYGCGSGHCGLSNFERENDYCPYDGFGEGRCDHHR